MYFFPNINQSDCNILDKYNKETPIISLSPILDGSISTITFNNYKGGYLAAKYLND